MFLLCLLLPPITSNFVVHTNGDAYHDLYEDITRHLATGEILLLGDFNARTSTLQVPLHDITKDDMQTHELDPEELGFVRSSTDKQVTAYGKHLLELRESNSHYSQWIILFY